MKGYVKNIGRAPIYIFKEVVNIDEIITFDVLLEKLGSIADTKNEKAFANWLSKNKFVNKSRWKIVVEETVKTEKPVEKLQPNKEEIKPENMEPVSTEPVSKVTTTNNEIIKQSVTGVKKEMTVDYIVNIKIVNMKKEVGRIDDLKLLKVALKKAEGMTKKATLCNALRDRITELSIRY